MLREVAESSVFAREIYLRRNQKARNRKFRESIRDADLKGLIQGIRLRRRRQIEKQESKED